MTVGRRAKWDALQVRARANRTPEEFQTTAMAFTSPPTPRQKFNPGIPHDQMEGGLTLEF